MDVKGHTKAYEGFRQVDKSVLGPDSLRKANLLIGCCSFWRENQRWLIKRPFLPKSSKIGLANKEKLYSIERFFWPLSCKLIYFDALQVLK